MFGPPTPKFTTIGNDVFLDKPALVGWKMNKAKGGLKFFTQS